MKKDNILVIGANGQLGSVLTRALRDQFGRNNVLATDIRMPLEDEGPFELLDVVDRRQLERLARKYRITQIYHLAAILSAKGEQNPKLAWDVNINGLFNALELAREEKLRLFFRALLPFSAAIRPERIRRRKPSSTPKPYTASAKQQERTGASIIT